MFETLFGFDLPTPVKFVIAFVLVLGLIAGAAYLVRRFGAGALNAAAMRGRQPRLAVIDAAAIDGRRRLVLIRRDNVEHLIMIGGPTDVVVEPNIVRANAAAPARETPPARGGIADALPRAVPLAEGSMWPLQPEPAPRPARSPAPTDESADWPAQPEPEPAPARAAPESAPRAQNSERLAGLAADLSRTFSDPEPTPSPPPTPRRSAEQRRAAAATPAVTAAPAVTASEDQNLADMAHRLENALHRPRPAAETPAGPMMPRGGDIPHVEPKMTRPESKPAAKPAFDSLEQEMASLLGRPSGKT